MLHGLLGMLLAPFNQKVKDYPEVREKQVQPTPTKHSTAEPEEIANLAVYLGPREGDRVHVQPSQLAAAFRNIRDTKQEAKPTASRIR